MVHEDTFITYEVHTTEGRYLDFPFDSLETAIAAWKAHVSVCEECRETGAQGIIQKVITKTVWVEWDQPTLH